MGHPMRLELTLAGLLVKLANHYTTRGAPNHLVYLEIINTICNILGLIELISSKVIQ